MMLGGSYVRQVGAVAMFPLSRQAAERCGVDPLAALPLERLHPCARARLTFGAEHADRLADRVARLMSVGAEWQPYLEDLDRERAALAGAYRRLLDDPPEDGR